MSDIAQDAVQHPGQVPRWSRSNGWRGAGRSWGMAIAGLIRRDDHDKAMGQSPTHVARPPNLAAAQICFGLRMWFEEKRVR